MYNLLVVDDEEVAIRGIAEGIDWSALPLAHIFTAYDAEEARRILGEHPIHVMISDIDMPQENGIELLAWANVHSPQTKTIFLTGHADFKYAQQAVHLSGFDYMLKPIDHALLRQAVEKALDEVAGREEEESLRRTYEFYYDQWNRQLPLLVERLWQDVLNLRLPATEEQLLPAFALYGLKLGMSSAIVPVLISIEEWKQEWSARDEEIMTYALKNAAADILLRDREGHIVQEQNGMLFALLYDADEDVEELAERCREYIRKCSEYLYGIVSCYIGEPVTAGGLRQAVRQLSEMERGNVSRMGAVHRKAPDAKPKRMQANVPDLEEWGELVLQGKKREVLDRIEQLFDRLQQEEADRDYLSRYYFGMIHIVYQLLQKKNLSPAELYGQGEWENGVQAMKSLGAMKAWSMRLLGSAADYMDGQGMMMSQTVVKVRQFIDDHLHLDLNRESIAEQVYLNPAYLSRLFRKETGLSLTDYMVDRRTSQAKVELARTNNKISDIASSVGYCNFSHFSKLFKKMTGLTPQEYRKRHQDVT
ncbi:response regulator transcription factor [Cohnella zeiphila]|uniref:Helix-turn-helix domain-containing protein n=1 Tax=Cohnella zeiphila TaxID=2761120 RepID=A0A7X0SPJ1_9BACL|nr:helix-turn-helix domain-containing protein [Cohnella zeiphila]MBB6733646.1 helix-turn-helix domain-containing protein [Cohnella zeiphila]